MLGRLCITRAVALGCALALATASLAAPAKPTSSGGAKEKATGGRAMRPTRTLIGAPEATDLDTDSVAVPLDLSGEGIAVMVEVNGHGPYPFLLDTATPGHGRIDPALAKQWSLPALGDARSADATLRSANRIDLVGIDSLRIGGAVFRGLQVAAFLGTKPIDPAVDRRGVLGFGLFHDVSLTLDYPDSQIVFTREELVPRDAHVIRLVAGDVARIPVQVGDVDFEALLNPRDNAGFSLPSGAVDTLHTVGEPWLTGRTRTFNNEFEVRAVRLSGPLRIAGHRFDVTEASYADVFRSPTLGAEVLRNFAVTLDETSGLVRFLRAGAGDSRLETRAKKFRGDRG